MYTTGPLLQIFILVMQVYKRNMHAGKKLEMCQAEIGMVRPIIQKNNKQQLTLHHLIVGGIPYIEIGLTASY